MTLKGFNPTCSFTMKPYRELRLHELPRCELRPEAEPETRVLIMMERLISQLLNKDMTNI